MAYTAALPQSVSSSAEFQVISASDVDQQATSTNEIPLHFFGKCCGFFLKSPLSGLVEVGRLGQQLLKMSSPKDGG